jgi:hypothetical protein
MKKLIALWSLIIAVFITSAALSFIGCKSTPQTVAVKTEGVIIKSVDTAMMAWKDYTDTHVVSQSSIDKVHSAYDKYYRAQIVAKAALEAWIASKTPDNEKEWETANRAIGEASANVIELVKGLLK